MAPTAARGDGSGEVVAAVDIGTNSVRLLVARPSRDGGLRTLDRQLRITRLGAGVDRTGRLDPAAVDRTVAALGEYHARWTHLGAARVRITATSAARDASNADGFRDAVVAVTGVAPEVLTGEQEAALAFDGALAGLRAGAGGVDGPVVVLDIGGGSTELVHGTDHVLASTSRQLGSVRLTEQHLHDDPPSPSQVKAARATVTAEMIAVARLVAPEPGDVLVGTAGTVTTLAAVHLGLGEWQDGAVHGVRLSADTVAELASRLCAMPTAERVDRLGVEPGRADVIAAGALVLDGVLAHFGFVEVVVSETDILDGIARSLG
ncbi:Ppx/GppA phosphatase family protein [Euzebya rosea]|uniref:Ppx/GppA phosphatase family protein n=1 Tax=Euzebya rosea TaxID=2052804 RepID=UPI000D3E81D9|nr:Ppx/GppA phosphatase family protein [Euzebya rosea]